MSRDRTQHRRSFDSTIFILHVEEVESSGLESTLADTWQSFSCFRRDQPHEYGSLSMQLLILQLMISDIESVMEEGRDDEG